MNLDDSASFAKLDPQNMLAEIDGLPDQLQAAWELGSRQELPPWTGLRQVLVAGMGGSAIGADLLAAAAAGEATVPLTVVRDYDLPAWTGGEETLVIASSHSGDTEETLAAYDTALRSGCRVLAMATGGELAAAAARAKAPIWTFEHGGQPRAAVGYSFGLLLAALSRLGVVPRLGGQVGAAVEAMRQQKTTLQAGSPAVRNPAKRMAGQLVGRWPVIFGSGILAPVARRWKTQINEIAKALAGFEFLPEADHNTLAGNLYPEGLISQAMLLFLRAPAEHPRNRLRAELTRKGFMLEGFNTDFVEAQGDSPLAQQWTCLQFGDYVSYYLAMAYAVDPTPVEALQNFKHEMRAASK